jgi:hypothetical protein
MFATLASIELSYISFCILADTVLAEPSEARQREQHDILIQPSHVSVTSAIRLYFSDSCRLVVGLLTFCSHHITIKKWIDDLTSFFGFCFSSLFIVHGVLRLYNITSNFHASKVTRLIKVF